MRDVPLPTENATLISALSKRDFLLSDSGVICTHTGMNSSPAKPILTDREASLGCSNRRRQVRQRVHTPAYASMESTGETAHDLCEVLDISESGLCIQSCSTLQAQQSVNLRLDLSETGAYISAPAEVIWCEPRGRAGIRFASLPGELTQQLKRWLFANAIAGVVNRSSADALPPPSRPQLVQRPIEATSLDKDATPGTPGLDLEAAADAIEPAKEASGLNSVLQAVVERARDLVNASSAAIALSSDGEIRCRATCGPSAPAVGAVLKSGAGFSGECIRTGQAMRCDDAETDTRADRESCRVLGIRSMLAVPIRADTTVIGLIEVFSSQPNEFGDEDQKALEDLAQRAANPDQKIEIVTGPDNMEPALAGAEQSSPDGKRSSSRSSRILLAASALTLAFVAIWLIGPWSKGGTSNAVVQKTQSTIPASAPVAQSQTIPKTPTSLRELAEQGDAAAEFAVGAKYATGDGVKRDDAEAVRWFTMAAEQGHVVAQATLGACYWAGRGVPLDLSKAYFWSILAEVGGNEVAKYRVQALAARMSHSQIVAAEQQANEWIKSHQLGISPAH